MKFYLILIFSSLISCNFIIAEPAKELADFSIKGTLWHQRFYDNSNKAVHQAINRKAFVKDEESVWFMVMPMVLPGKSEFVLSTPNGISGYDKLDVKVLVTEKLPAKTALYIFSKDWDSNWRQVRIPLPAGSQGMLKFSVPLYGEEAQKVWRSKGHHSPLHSLVPKQTREVGLAIASDTGAKTSFKGAVYLKSFTLINGDEKRSDAIVRGFNCENRLHKVGQISTFSFEYLGKLDDPFSKDEIKIDANITLPDGSLRRISGFYYEGFLFDPHKKQSYLIPFGHPRFKVRFTPKVAGEYVVAITITTPNGVTKLPKQKMVVQKAPFKGFVKVDKDDRCTLSYGNGDAFWGIGMNVRSPFDNRHIDTCPYSSWQDEKLSLYKRLFKKYKENGINVVEVWMSSWWLALEWIPDAPGNHGVGYMNQYRAWKLDKILQWAEEYDIHLILVFNNHGKFGMRFDTEWNRNPFNIKNGGYLNRCEEYFSNEKAKGAFKKFADYCLARWGANSRILSWKLFTEIDLTGKDPKFYRQPVMKTWHQDMASYIKSNDPYKHPITTHWMYNYRNINSEVADLPEIDLLTADAYYPEGQGTKGAMQMIRGTAGLAKKKNKPIIITEYGGSPYADGMSNLLNQSHLGIWAGFLNGSSVSPMFWWFAITEEKNSYSYYRSLANFAKGDEDRRGMISRVKEQRLGKHHINVHELCSPNKMLIWGFDREYYYSKYENSQAPTISNFKLNMSGIKNGQWSIQFWDVAKGEVIDTIKKQVIGGNLVISVPNFKKDFAIKIIHN